MIIMGNVQNVKNNLKFKMDFVLQNQKIVPFLIEMVLVVMIVCLENFIQKNVNVKIVNRKLFNKLILRYVYNMMIIA